jgi:hypothetical protein
VGQRLHVTTFSVDPYEAPGSGEPGLGFVEFRKEELTASAMYFGSLMAQPAVAVISRTPSSGVCRAVPIAPAKGACRTGEAPAHLLARGALGTT